MEFAHLIITVVGFVATVAVLKNEVKNIKIQINGIGKKLNETREEQVQNKIDIEILKDRETRK